MATSRGVYDNFSVDYVVIRGGKQELNAHGLFMNTNVVDKDYHVLLSLDSSCRGEYGVTPLEQEQLVNAYTQYITDRLKFLQTRFPHEQRRVLFISSSYIPRPLIEITGARTEMISCFLNCFGKVYVVNGESFCNPEFLDKWSAGNSLPQHLQVAHAALDSYIPVKMSKAETFGLFSGEHQDTQVDWYRVYTEDHIMYITTHYVRRLSLKWSSQAGRVEGRVKRKPNCEYVIKTCGSITFVYEYHSLESEFILNKLKALLAHIF